MLVTLAKMQTGFAKFKNHVHSSNRPLSYEWLTKFLDKWIQGDNKEPNPSHQEMLDYILDHLVNRFHWKKALWIFAAVLNRINCSEDQPMFVRMKSVFVDLLTSSGIKFHSHDIAELEVIRNHLSLHLNHPTLKEMRDTLKNAYYTSKSSAEKNQSSSHHPSWKSLVATITSKTSFEHIYPPRSSDARKESLFWVDGKPVQIPPHPPCTCHKAIAGPYKEPHPDDNVIEIHNILEVGEAFKIFVGHFFHHMEEVVSSRLMRSMILITIDLLDVALTHGIYSVNQLFQMVGCGRNMEEPKLFSRGLFILWVWAGAVSNPSHLLTLGEISEIEIQDKVDSCIGGAEVKDDDGLKRREVLALSRRIDRNAVVTIEIEDFHSFLVLLAKFYPRPEKGSQREEPLTELEKMFLNIRLQFDPPSPCSYFLKRLCATSRRYCSRGRDHLSKNSRSKDMDACGICDSSSEEDKDENPEDDDSVITN